MLGLSFGLVKNFVQVLNPLQTVFALVPTKNFTGAFMSKTFVFPMIIASFTVFFSNVLDDLLPAITKLVRRILSLGPPACLD